MKRNGNKIDCNNNSNINNVIILIILIIILLTIISIKNLTFRLNLSGITEDYI